MMQFLCQFISIQPFLSRAIFHFLLIFKLFVVWFSFSSLFFSSNPLYSYFSLFGYSKPHLWLIHWIYSMWVWATPSLLGSLCASYTFILPRVEISFLLHFRRVLSLPAYRHFPRSNFSSGRFVPKSFAWYFIHSRLLSLSLFASHSPLLSIDSVVVVACSFMSSPVFRLQSGIRQYKKVFLSSCISFDFDSLWVSVRQQLETQDFHSYFLYTHSFWTIKKTF